MQGRYIRSSIHGFFRLIPCLLAAAMLASCADSAVPSPTGVDSTGTETAAASATTPEIRLEPEDTTKAIDKPMTISWLSINAPVEDETWGERYLESTFGVDIKLEKIYSPDWRQKADILLAGGEVPDFMRLDSIDTLRNYYDKDYLAALKPEEIRSAMPGYCAIVDRTDPHLLSYALDDGLAMGIPIAYANGRYPIPAAIRADWLATVGEERVPETIDDLERVFHKFRYNDPDRDNVVDTYAMTMGTDCPRQYRFQSIFGAYGVNPYQWRRTTDGQLEFGFVTEDFLEALKRLQKWSLASLIDPDFATITWRSGGQDVAGSFASGETGYIDSYSFDDHQWDNDGNLNAAWVRNQPGWQRFFEENKADSDILYGTQCFFNLEEATASQLPGPVYIDLPPVKGPDGRSGYVRDGQSLAYAAIGYKTDAEKRAKILSMLETLATDEKTYVLAHFGPEGKAWLTEADGTRVFNPKWSEDPDYHPQWVNTGTGYWANPMYLSNPDFLTVLGGARTEQRYRFGASLLEWPQHENVLKAGLTSATIGETLTTTTVDAFILQALATDVDLDAVFPKTVADWMAAGGRELTDAANEWAKSLDP